jgi:hypothetical protein
VLDCPGWYWDLCDRAAYAAKGWYTIAEHREAQMIRRLEAEQATQARQRAERESRAASLAAKNAAALGGG